jgi:hypothetical protein
MMRRSIAVATVTAALLSAGLVAPAAASAQTFTVTDTNLCGGAGTFEQAVKEANATPGADTIEFTPGLTYVGYNCYRNALDLPSPMVVDESVTIVGNGAVVDGGQVYLDPGGNVNRPYECPTSGRLHTAARTAGFVAVGSSGSDNSGITATIRGFELKNLTTVATVYQNAALVLEDTTAHDIIDFNVSCNRPLIMAFAGGDVTVRNSLIFDSPSPRATDPTGMIDGDGGDLVLDHVGMGESTFPRVVSWRGGTVTIVSSRLLAGGGMYLDGAKTQIVNSAFWSRKQGESERILTRNELTTVRASSFYWTEPVGTGIEAAGGGAVALYSSAVGGRAAYPGAGPLLVGSGTFVSDAMSWVQPIGSWDPTTVLPDLLVGPGLPDYGSSGEVWTSAVTPLPSGVLVGAVLNATTTNQLVSPIDSSPIAVDVLGNPRVDVDKRDTGAVQTVAPPHLTALGVGDGSVELGWNRPAPPSGRTITGYTVGRRIAGTADPLVTTAVSGAGTISATITGLTNGTRYQFIAWANYDDATDSPDSNPVEATPFAAIGAPAPSATPGQQQVSLFWTEPAAGGHPGPLSYYVVYRPAGTTTWLSGPGPIGARTTTIPGLTGGTHYEFGVFAGSPDGTFSGTGTTTATPTSPPTPAPEPSPTATPTSTPTPTTPARQPLAPVVNAQTTKVLPGSTLVLLGGAPASATSGPTSAGTGVLAGGPGWTLTVGGLLPNGSPAQLGAGAALQVQTGSRVTAAGTGFEPGTQANAYILDPAVTLGTCPVGADGSFACTLDLPTTLLPGNHVLQVNGYTPDQQVRSVSLGLQVTPNPTAVSRRVRTTVYFDVLSAHLDARARRDLAALVRKVPKRATNVTVQVTGYVQPTSTTANDTSLSTARARRTAAALRADGLKGRYYVSGEGRSSVTGAKGRRVVVVVAFRLLR